jgi:hypothetical protein
MIRLILRSSNPGRGRLLGRPFAHPLAWCRMTQNCRWMPVAPQVVARTYMSLPIHLFSFSSQMWKECGTEVVR